ncbi:MAG: hypothetical protein D6701_03955 [Gemmatimonadetes bacterium]|nr:MAG: hypothetical protein D6701_03955 [Gemmatimonadota bacterium]
MKTFVQLSAAGLIAAILWELLGMLAAPLLGMLFGLLILLGKIAFVVAVGFLVVTLVRRWRDRCDEAAEEA